MYEVLLSPEARTFYARADRLLAQKLARCFVQLERNPDGTTASDGSPGSLRAGRATGSAIGG